MHFGPLIRIPYDRSAAGGEKTKKKNPQERLHEWVPEHTATQLDE